MKIRTVIMQFLKGRLNLFFIGVSIITALTINHSYSLGKENYVAAMTIWLFFTCILYLALRM